MHAILIAKATVLPAWMQLLHPLATFIAKSKLLVIPVYPAAWPQAKKHPLVQGLFAFYRYLIGLPIMQKAEFRYDQIDTAAQAAGGAIARAADRLGLTGLMRAFRAAMRSLAQWSGATARVAATCAIRHLSSAALVGPIVRSYAAHYTGAQQHEPLSEKMSSVFARWSINFSAEYYEAKERAASSGRMS
jgi:hypothetical protein